MDSSEIYSPYDQQNEALKDFDYAVVRIAVLLSPKSDQTEKPPLRLLFASVWLVPPGRQIPLKRCDTITKYFKKNEGGIAIDRIVMKAQDAINWYRSSLGAFTTPKPFKEPKAFDGIPLIVGNLGDFPRWPILGVPMQSEDLTDSSAQSSLPFKNLGIIRYSRRISENQSWPEFLNPNARTKDSDEAYKFLERHIHVDFKEYPEYLGSITLAVPDISIHSVRQFIEPKSTGSESLYLHLKPHYGQTLQHLNLTVFEGQEGMLTSFQMFKVPEDGLIEIKRPTAIDTAGLVLTHEKRGVLLQTPMRSFLRQMHSTIQVVDRHINVTAPETEGKKSSVYQYHTDKKTIASTQTYGDPYDNTEAFKRLIEAQNERKLNHSARLYDQEWFDFGQRKAALNHIIAKIRNARVSIFIADPYFSANQITQYLFAIESDNIQVKILTSNYAFQKPRTTEEDASTGTLAGNDLSSFKSSIEKFRRENGNPLEIKIAHTNETYFHDRFIAIDGRVWMLGSSLNSIGIRPTLIMRVPHGEKILNHLDYLFDRSSSLEDKDESDA